MVCIMRNQKKLLLEQLDNKLSAFNGTETIQIPDKGWIYNIRTALNMTLEQLGQKLNITKQGAKKIEERESTRYHFIDIIESELLDSEIIGVKEGVLPKKLNAEYSITI